MTTTVIAGADPDGLGKTLEDEDAMVVCVAGIASADSLSKAGIEDADLLVLTDMDDVTAITVAKKQNPNIRVVTYTYGTLPGFAKGQANLTIDPNLLAIDVVTGEPV